MVQHCPFQARRYAHAFDPAGLHLSSNFKSIVYGGRAGKNTNIVTHRLLGDPLGALNGASIMSPKWPVMVSPGRHLYYESVSGWNPLANHSLGAFRGQIDGVD